MAVWAGLDRARFLAVAVVVASIVALTGTPPAAAEEAPPSYVTQWGTWGSGGHGQFQSPLGVAVDDAGNVYVVDAFRIQKFTSTGTFVTQWGTYGSGNGQFQAASGVAVDGDSNVYVSDAVGNRIQKFTSTGTYLAQWGSEGSGNGRFNGPHGLAVDGAGNVYVADADNHRIQKFTSAGTYLTQWAGGAGQFGQVFGVAVDSAGDIYVADAGNSWIQKFTSTGTYLTQWGTYGSGNGQFDYPWWVAVDSANGIYVADNGNNRIQRFGGSGALEVFKYVALGDSFSAGEGIEDFFPADPGNTCHRSTLAYSTLVEQPGEPGASIYSRRQASGVQWGFQACSGAVTADVVDQGRDDPLAQLDQNRTGDTNPNDLPVDSTTDLVTITIGGNDLEFSTMLSFCFRNADCTTGRLPASSPDFGKRLARYQRELRDRLSPELDRVYAQIHRQAPNARILVLGYPQLMPATAAEQRCGKLNFGFSLVEQNYLRQATSEANQLIAARVEAADIPAGNITFVPVDATFAGHEVCGRDGEWINFASVVGVRQPRLDPQSFHPNQAGQRDGYAIAVNDVLNPAPRPDGRIRVGANGTRVGDDVYNTTGQDQTRQASATPGHTVTYYASFQNDGPVAGQFRISGGGNEGRFRIRYRQNGDDITDQIVAGTYLTETLASGPTSTQIEVQVTVRAGSLSGLTRTLTATSQESGRQDTVRFRTT